MTTPAALVAVACNAARHLIEANEHYNEHRYASAVSSAIFAIEETGKLAIHSVGGEAPKSNKRHAAHALLFYALGRLSQDFQSMLEWQPILRNGWTRETTLTERQQRTLAEHPEFAKLVERMQAGELSTLAERTLEFVAALGVKADRDGTNAKWKPIVEQGLNQLRIQATYVDVTDTGFRTPYTITEGEAYALCWFGLGLLLLQLAMSVNVGPLKEYKAEIAKILPERGLVGQADIAQFVEAFTKAAGQAAG
jgi:hypothetical protein